VLLLPLKFIEFGLQVPDFKVSGFEGYFESMAIFLEVLDVSFLFIESGLKGEELLVVNHLESPDLGVALGLVVQGQSLEFSLVSLLGTHQVLLHL
jgi:hypothetical protein